jgi:hypothetical protein
LALNVSLMERLLRIYDGKIISYIENPLREFAFSAVEWFWRFMLAPPTNQTTETIFDPLPVPFIKSTIGQSTLQH